MCPLLQTTQVYTPPICLPVLLFVQVHSHSLESCRYSGTGRSPVSPPEVEDDDVNYVCVLSVLRPIASQMDGNDAKRKTRAKVTEAPSIGHLLNELFEATGEATLIQVQAGGEGERSGLGQDRLTEWGVMLIQVQADWRRGRRGIRLWQSEGGR